MPRRKPRGRPLDGWLIIDKPPGLTSTDVVNRVRRAFDAQKAGHGGTLDPLATGVLPIAFGAATKTVPYVMDGTKLYRFTLRFGEARDTDDADGQVTATTDARPTDDADPRRAAGQFRGDIMQIPPAFSAVKVAGERAYDMAREGRAAGPGTPPRPGGPLRTGRAPRPRHRGVRGRLRQGRLHAQPGARPRAGLRHAWATSPPCAACGSARSPRRRRFRWTNCARRTIPPPASPDLLLPVATALADIPALALTEAEAGGLRHGQAISLVTLMGRIPGSGRSRWGVGARHGGGPRDRAVPAGRRLAEARTGAVSRVRARRSNPAPRRPSDVDHRGAPHGARLANTPPAPPIPAARKCRSPCCPSGSAT